MKEWTVALVALVGPGHYPFSQSNIGSRVLAPAERVEVLVMRFPAEKSDVAARFDKDRFRIGMEICYCSTLGECWTLTAPAHEPARTVETGRCPVVSESSFHQ